MTTAMTHDSTIERNVRLLHSLYNAINTWNFDALRDIFHPDVVIEIPYAFPPYPTEVRGRDQVMAFMEPMPEFVEEENLHDFKTHAFADDPNELVCEHRADMKLRSGRPYQNSYVVRATVKDDKIIRYRVYWNAIPLIIARGGNVTFADS
jgi:ketosteroid isomerase-like protein